MIIAEHEGMQPSTIAAGEGAHDAATATSVSPNRSILVAR